MRTIDEYMDFHSGRKVSGMQYLAVQKWYEMSAELERMRDQKRILQQCGLDAEAKRVQRIINEKENERRAYEDQLNDERKIMAKQLLVCFAVCDLATTAADKFGALAHKLSRGLYGNKNNFTDELRQQAEAWNKLVQIIDTGGNMKAAMLYADMAEEICDRVFPLIEEVINKYINTPKGKQYF